MMSLYNEKSKNLIKENLSLRTQLNLKDLEIENLKIAHSRNNKQILHIVNVLNTRMESSFVWQELLPEKDITVEYLKKGLYAIKVCVMEDSNE